jgi:hypothetical protein
MGMSSSQLTNSIIFERGRAQPPSRYISRYSKLNVHIYHIYIYIIIHIPYYHILCPYNISYYHFSILPYMSNVLMTFLVSLCCGAVVPRSGNELCFSSMRATPPMRRSSTQARNRGKLPGWGRDGKQNTEGLPSQMLHVWNIYLHLPQKLPKCRKIFHTWSIWAYKTNMFYVFCLCFFAGLNQP